MAVTDSKLSIIPEKKGITSCDILLKPKQESVGKANLITWVVCTRERTHSVNRLKTLKEFVNGHRI